MEHSIIDILLLAGCIAWWSTALVKKDGPWFIFTKFRVRMSKLLGGDVNNPLTCVFCTGFWVGLFAISVWSGHEFYTRELISFFGVLGIAAALRGLSAEF